MLREYFKLTPVYIKRRRIQGEVRNDDNKNNRINAFNKFVDKLREDENLLNAIRDTQRECDMPITFDTILPDDPHEYSTIVIKVG